MEIVVLSAVGDAGQSLDDRRLQLRAVLDGALEAWSIDCISIDYI